MTVLMRSVCVLVTFAFSLSHGLEACCEKRSRVCKPSSPIITSHTETPMWPRYRNRLEVVDGNWMLHGSRKKLKVSEETRPFDEWHAWPTGVWICPGVCKPSSQLWVKPPLPCGIPIYGKGLGRKPRRSIQFGTCKVPPVPPGNVLYQKLRER